MRAVILLAIGLVAVIGGVYWFTQNQGTVTVDWLGQIVEVQIGLALGGLAVGFMVLYAAVRLLVWLVTVPPRFLMGKTQGRKDKGYRVLTQGLVAVAAGDKETADRCAKRATRLLENQPLTKLLSAASAQLGGDERASHDYFEAMLANPDTEFLGLRGLMTEALRHGEDARALDYATRAKALKPETPWLAKAAFEIEARMRKWADAQISLARAGRLGAVDADTAKLHKTAILIERSRETEAEGDLKGAQIFARDALKLRPDFVPAIRRDAVLLARQGQYRKAQKIIEKAWETAPHPILAYVYGQVGPERETAVERVKRYERLFQLNQDAPESLIALGKAEMEARLWGAARTHLARAAELAPSRTVYRLMSDLEVGETGDNDAAEGWLQKAAGMQPDETWVCTVCNTSYAAWQGICDTCHSFDTVFWQRPKPGGAIAAGLLATEEPISAALLPPVNDPVAEDGSKPAYAPPPAANAA